MAGFEVIVRPVVFPNIRPQPARSLPPADDPEKGFATIKGDGAKHLALSASWSASMSKGRPTEIKRRVDTARVYQKDDNGKINRDNFVDVDVANKIWTDQGKGPGVDDDSIRDAKDNAKVRPGERFVNETQKHYYQRMQEKDNIEIKERDKIIENKDYAGGGS